MKEILALTKATCLSFFRDRASFVFSVLAASIIFVLYVLVLRDMFIADYPGYDGMDNLMDSWVLSGMLGVVSVASSTVILQFIIADRNDGRDQDILVTPLGPYRIAAGHVLSTFIAGLIMSFIVLTIVILYLALTGCPLSAGGMLVTAVLLVPSSMSSAVIMFCITSFFRTAASTVGMNAIISTTVATVTGVYMPITSMPEIMQEIIMFFPATHFVSMFRNALAGDALDSCFAGADPYMLDMFRHDLGFDLFLNGTQFTLFASILVEVLVTLLFFAVAVFNIRRYRGS